MGYDAVRLGPNARGQGGPRVRVRGERIMVRKADFENRERIEDELSFWPSKMFKLYPTIAAARKGDLAAIAKLRIIERRNPFPELTLQDLGVVLNKRLIAKGEAENTFVQKINDGYELVLLGASNEKVAALLGLSLPESSFRLEGEGKVVVIRTGEDMLSIATGFNQTGLRHVRLEIPTTPQLESICTIWGKEIAPLGLKNICSAESGKAHWLSHLSEIVSVRDPFKKPVCMQETHDPSRTRKPRRWRVHGVQSSLEQKTGIVVFAKPRQ
jgi:hypothetical protein